MRISILNYTKEAEKQDLAQFLADNCEYINSKEQEEIDELMKKLGNDTDDGREISLDGLLQL